MGFCTRCRYYTHEIRINISVLFSTRFKIVIIFLTAIFDTQPNMTRYWANVGLILGEWRILWAKIETTPDQRVMFPVTTAASPTK